MQRFTEWSNRIRLCLQADRHSLRRKLAQLERDFQKGGDISAKTGQFLARLDDSVRRCEARRQSVPPLSFDEELPVNQIRKQIATAITGNQVVVVCGETGSGKSTQLPKICLEVGRGVSGFIGHTQPRRIAARSIATRISQELSSTVGQHVGYKVRFTDKVQPASYIKLMTDGILLAETQNDRFLDQYDTIILDEAHDRSLNIDFLIGYLRRLLPKRRDLRLIVTSATIDAERFADHFRRPGVEVPVIQVEGRTHPVELRYHRPDPSEAEDQAQPKAIIAALEELSAEGPGDILCFLPTERDIRDTSRRLRGWCSARTEKIELLPLYARLPTSEQNRVFQPGKRRRIVLATNVAESSLTVPRIRYVIDTGTARISRYSPRSKVQMLPVTGISQASADQRAGRCGRIGPGICIRLFGEDDFLTRDRFTAPELRRTNLAAVILRMLALGLGEVSRFPFLDRPRPDAVADGYHTLFELGAIDENNCLTGTGRAMSRLPVDPRISRMILAADDGGCLAEVLIIAAALEVQDPRLRPPGKEEASDQAHSRFADSESDFLTYLNLWDQLQRLRDDLSRSRLRKALNAQFISWNRVREWQETYRQLRELITQNRYKVEARKNEYEPIHRALLHGLLANIAVLAERHEYRGANDSRSFIWPGSSLFGRKAKWVMAAELLETNKRYIRTVAKIEPEWIEPSARHLVERTYGDPKWSRKRSTVVAVEKVNLYGIRIQRRQARYGNVDPAMSRHLFIQRALVEGDWNGGVPFYKHNKEFVESLATMAARSRDNSFLISHDTQYSFYDERIPQHVVDTASLRRWLKSGEGRRASQELFMRSNQFVSGGSEEITRGFPNAIRSGGLVVELSYRYDPGESEDGISISVPAQALGQLDPQRLEWCVPGVLQEKLVALTRTLPKAIRRRLIPARETAEKAIARMEFGVGPFLPTVAATLSEVSGIEIRPDLFDIERVPDHLRLNIKVVDSEGNTVARGRALEKVRQQVVASARGKKTKPGEVSKWHRDGIKSWDFDELPERIDLDQGGCRFSAFPMLVDQTSAVGIRLSDTQSTAEQQTRRALRRLCCLLEKRVLANQVKWFPRLPELQLIASQLGHQTPLSDQLLELLAERAFLNGAIPRDPTSFERMRVEGRAELSGAVQEATKVVTDILDHYQQLRLIRDRINSPVAATAMGDIDEQLALLFCEGYLVQTPWQWLAHYPRYLRAIIVRLDRMQSGNAARDAQRVKDLRPWLDAYAQRKQQHALRSVVDPELELFRWMLEEQRVSFFAEKLGTAVKVSLKRLEKQWEKVLW